MVSAPVGATSEPTLVKDIKPTGGSNPTSLTAVGSTLFFAANDGVHGNELWKSDGTAAGTKMVKNIRPYGKNSDPDNLVNVNGMLFFTAIDGVHGRELWKSDGTKAGTVMVKDLIPSGGLSILSADVGGVQPVAVGSRLFLFNSVCRACPFGEGSDLYVSDGTASGTKQLAPDQLFSSVHSRAAALDGKLYFATSSETYDGLWVTDGTQAGTHILASVSVVGDSIDILPASGKNLYFIAYQSGQPRLWKTNGAAASTKALTTGGTLGWDPREAAFMAKRVFFDSGYWDSALGESIAQLWKTDGTVAGTKPILTTPGGLGWVRASGGRLYFNVSSDISWQLWTSDGTAGGTRDMGQFGAQRATDPMAVGGDLCFTEMDWNTGTWALWKSDGTTPGTYPVRSFVGPTEEFQQAAFGSKLFFAADDGVHGQELWNYTP
ncbi:MAG: ELWxxDGT repeat protein [Chloroflexota bacterium]